MNADLYLLALPIQRGDQTVYFNASLILHARHGPTRSILACRRQLIDGQAHMAELDVQTIMCYHGGVVVVNANQQLQQVAQELAQK